MKTRRWLICLLIVVSLALVFFFVILLESFSLTVSPEEFTHRMEEAGYSVEERASPYKQVTLYLVADCEAFYVKLMVHQTMTDARFTFAQLRSDLERLDDILAFTWSSSGFSSWYEQSTSDGQWARMIRVRNTIVFVSTTEENAADVLFILEMLGH